MKLDGNGQAKILDPDEIGALFSEGLKTDRDRALGGICLFTGCRIGEACQLKTKNISGGRVIFPKAITKGRRGTREIPISPRLQLLLDCYQCDREYLFPGRWGRGHLHPNSADRILRDAFERIGLIGASSHSFRRTALTEMHRKGIPLGTIQRISGHESLAALQRYLEVSEGELRSAVQVLNW
ncbi:site-specific integrase [Laspinema sp. D1]|uniref:Site-specific integrase n=1 Tax=Laspinema palackyanum D2a TaxID=2953684 RepID=A0ABT2N3K2_9CYAN|nr:site-specific integrase [Laspinema sp. D2a]